jgi:hypothetical protein
MYRFTANKPRRDKIRQEYLQELKIGRFFGKTAPSARLNRKPANERYDPIPGRPALRRINLATVTFRPTILLLLLMK